MLTLSPERHDAVIFDCDGTLVDSMPLHHSAWKEAFARYEAPFDFTWDLFNRRAGMTLEKTVEALNLEFGCQLPPDLVANAQRAAYQVFAVEIRPIEFVVEFARRVAATHPIAVASGSSLATVQDALERVHLLDCISTIVTPADVQDGKPAPDMFLLAAKHMSVRPERCLVVEDGELGLVAAARAHMDAYRVDREGRVTFLPYGDGR